MDERLLLDEYPSLTEDQITNFMSYSIYYLSSIAVSCIFWFVLRRIFTRRLKEQTYNVFSTVHALIVASVICFCFNKNSVFRPLAPSSSQKEILLLYTCGYHLHVALEVSLDNDKMLFISSVYFMATILYVLLLGFGVELLLLYMFLIESCTPSLCLAAFVHKTASENRLIKTASKAMAVILIINQQLLIGYSMTRKILTQLSVKHQPAVIALCLAFYFSLFIRFMELSKFIKRKKVIQENH